MLHYNPFKGRRGIQGEEVFHIHDMIYGQYAGRPGKLAPTVILDENLSLIVSYEPAKYIFSFHTQTITKGSIPHPSAAMAEIPLTSLRAR